MVRLAYATIKLIDDRIERDQGAAFRQILEKHVIAAKDAFEGKKDDFRSHLGGSSIGEDCARALYYNFHWAKVPKFSGRMIRLFNRGHLEEARFVAMLEMIGCKVWSHDENGNQFRISGVGGHYGSAIDSVIVDCPDVPDEPILGEYKTHNNKSFNKLLDHGVKVSKFKHYVQMQQYMGYFKLRFALYLAVNKDTDEIYGEIVEYDESVFKLYWSRAEKICLASEPPPRIADSISSFKCKYCDYKELCHMSATPAVNCRTCAGSVACSTGEWKCIKFNVVLDKPTQLTGCQEYDRKMEFTL